MKRESVQTLKIKIEKLEKEKRRLLKLRASDSRAFKQIASLVNTTDNDNRKLIRKVQKLKHANSWLDGYNCALLDEREQHCCDIEPDSIYKVTAKEMKEDEIEKLYNQI